MSLESKVVGAAFESFLETQHAIAERTGILAHVVHNQPTANFVGGRLVYTEAGVADYTGTLDRGAVTFAAEAKSTKQDYLKKSAITDLQQRHLTAVACAGGLALLVVEYRFDSHPFRTRFAIPWLKVPWKIAKTKERLNAADISSEWIINVAFGDGDCYLSKFHAPGPSSNPRGQGRFRSFRRE
jgi:hypothetical protein